MTAPDINMWVRVILRAISGGIALAGLVGFTAVHGADGIWMGAIWALVLMWATYPLEEPPRRWYR